VAEIVFGSDAPTKALHIYDPDAHSYASVALPLAPSAVSVSRDGKHAAVGHDGWVSYVDIGQRAVLETCPVSYPVVDINLASNGLMYVFPGNGNDRAHTIAPTGCRLVSSGYAAITKVESLPSGTRLFGAGDLDVAEIPIVADGSITSRAMHIEEFIDVTAGMRAWPREIDATTT
jgi:hypothetical protein